MNGAVRLLGKLLRRDHSVRDDNVSVIVLSKFVGMGSIRQSCEFKRGLYTHLVYLNCFRHISEAYSQMARLAGAEAEAGLLRPELTGPERQAARTFIREALPFRGSRVLAVNANASDLLLE